MNDYEKKALNEVLMLGVTINNPVIVQAALEQDADPDYREREDHDFYRSRQKGLTPLMIAAYQGPQALKTVSILLAAGANAQAFTKEGDDVLMFAASGCARSLNFDQDATPLIDALVHAGANPKTKLANGHTCLLGTLNEYDGLVSTSAFTALLAHGADPDASNGNGSLIDQLKWKIEHTRSDRKPFELCLQLAQQAIDKGRLPKRQPKMIIRIPGMKM